MTFRNCSPLVAVGTLLLLLALPAQAQQAAQQPASLEAADALPLDRVARVAMPAVDNDALIARDEAAAAARGADVPAPHRFAEPFPTTLSTRSGGTWEALEDGTRIWRLVLASPEAYSLNFGFSRFRLPEGARLWLYPAGEAPHFRAFTAADNEDHGELWTPIVRGDEVVVELNLPRTKPGAEPDFELEIGQVNHAYRPFGVAIETAEDAARSGSCNVDVVCPEGNGYRDIIRSAGAYTIGGTDTCSGSAVNNAAGDGAPYFLTADHCGVSAGNGASMVIYWNYENSTCRPPGSSQSGGPGDGSRDQFSSGVTFLDDSGGGTGSGSDWTLVETDDPIPPEYGVFLSGWDRRDQATESAVTIHHPNVEEKRISFENDPTSITDYLEPAPNANGTHIRIEDWDLGTTEPGSSGSPLYSPEKRIIGQLSGGFASCTSQTADWYGRMAHNMNTGLATLLDPGNTGVEFIDGIEGGNPPGPIQLLASMAAEPISVSPGETTTITVEIFNNGTEAAEEVSFENALPDLLAFAGNLTTSAGDASESGGTVTWTVEVGDDGSETISFDVAVAEDAPGVPITNEAVVDHPSLSLPLRPSTVIDIFVAPDFFYSNQEALAIPDDGCPSFVSSTIEVTDTFEPINLKVGVLAEHTWRGDLQVEVENPAGVSATLINSVGGSSQNLDALFSDTGDAGVFESGDHDVAPPFYEVEGAPAGSGAGTLTSLFEDDPQGTWTLSVCDDAGADVGNIVQWALLFYTDSPPPTSTEDDLALAEAYRIDAAYPNPFANEAVVRFAVREAQEVRAEVYDALGRRVQVLHEGLVAPDALQTLRIDGSGLAGGVYLVRFTGETFTASQKVLVVK